MYLVGKSNKKRHRTLFQAKTLTIRNKIIQLEYGKNYKQHKVNCVLFRSWQPKKGLCKNVLFKLNILLITLVYSMIGAQPES